ncbi:MAG: hypothetical protein LKJ81_03010 [Bacilli bacterium]|nr:hypothetical protein [Bacilli bacterium]
MDTEILNQMLLDTIPEIKSEFLDFVSWQDSMKTSEYTTYGFLFLPFFVRAVEQKNKDAIGRCSGLVERLASLDDPKVSDFVWTGIVEVLKDNNEGVDVRPSLGPLGTKTWDGLQ